MKKPTTSKSTTPATRARSAHHAAATPPPQRTLSQEATDLCATLAKEFRISDTEGKALLRIVGESFDSMAEAQRLIDLHGAVTVDRFGQLRGNPACAILRDARASYMRALRELNLSAEDLKHG